jgi:hypothetical protein
MQSFPKAAEGIRTLDLLHGKQSVCGTWEAETPANRVSGRLDRTLAFQELGADTGGLDNQRTMSDADGGGLPRRRPFGPRSALLASSVSRLPGRSRYDGRSPSDSRPHIDAAASLRSSTGAAVTRVRNIR